MANNHTAGAAARTFAPSELCQRMLAKTSKGTCGPCILYLEDGTIFYGRACGAEGTATGEVCFNTSLEGYFEVMTDPSYAGQIVTMTYPQIGNYGIDETDVQSAFPGDAVRPASAPAMRGMIVRDMCATPSNWRSAVSVPEYLRAHGIVAIEGVDTRALVRHLRDNGSKMGIISTEIFDVDELAERLAAAPTLVGENLVKTVSCPEPHAFAAVDLPATHDFALAAAALPVYRRKRTMRDSSLSPSSRLGGAVISDRIVSALLEELRTGGVLSPTEVGTAIMETSGKLSVFPTSQKRPVTPEDMKLKTGNEGIPLTLILDGQLEQNNLPLLGKDESWLRQQLGGMGFSEIRQVLLCYIDTDGVMSVHGFRGEPPERRRVLSSGEVRW